LDRQCFAGHRFGQLLPIPVVSEILAGPESDPARRALEDGFGQRVEVEIPADLLEWGLGPGETAVLALAQKLPRCTAILDDAAARDCAKALSVSLIGTLGVVLRAKKRGLVPEASQVLKALRDAGIHLDDRTTRLALGRIGETWPSET